MEMIKDVKKTLGKRLWQKFGKSQWDEERRDRNNFKKPETGR